MKKQINKGQKFNFWTIIKEITISSKNRKFLCECKCGIIKPVYLWSLISNNSKSCGCRRIKHGRYAQPEYRAWERMIQRCLNKNCSNYSHYGGRKIKIAKTWLNFKNFYKDMGPKPNKDYMLDRKNTKGHYYPSNCRWVTKLQSARNTLRTKFYVINNIKYDSLTDAAKLNNVSPATITRWCNGFIFKQHAAQLRKPQNCHTISKY